MEQIEIKLFPPPEGMTPNVLVVIKIPEYIYNDILPYSLEEIRHAIFSVAEQEINVHTSCSVKVSVIIESIKEE